MKTFKEFLIEGKSVYVVVYGGRFQPMHKGHYEVYRRACEVFGAKNVYVATSDVNGTDERSGKARPFNFAEKLVFMTRIFGIKKNRVVKTSGSPIFSPKEITEANPGLAVINVVGGKDSGRYDGTEYVRIESPTDVEVGGKYYFDAGEMEGGLSSTKIRSDMKGATEEEFTEVFGKFDRKAYDLLQR